VIKHFDDFHEDQFDFHSYCVRKVTLRAYTDVLKFEDKLWGDDYYFTAAEGTIQIYLCLHDNPSIRKENDEPDYSKMTAAERKKAKAIARKKRAQVEKKKAEKNKEKQAADNGGGQKPPKEGEKLSLIEEDPDGKQLLKADPLEEARKYSAILSKHCPKRVGTWVLQYDVAIRRGKVLLALQALFRLKHLDSNGAAYILRMVDFALKVLSFQLSGAVKNVVTVECSKLLSGKSIVDFVIDLAAQARSDPFTPLPLRVVIAESLVSTKSEPAVKAASVIIDGGLHMRGFNIDSCRVALASLKSFGSDSSTSVEQWIRFVQERYPLVKDFS